MERVHGIETEYGFSFSLADPKAQRDNVPLHLMRLGQMRLPHLKAIGGNGLFLANGAKLLIDAGGHPEFCTPETLDPWETARYALAGDDILRALVTALPAEINALTDVRLFKCNVDYHKASHTWACHENYGHRADLSRLPFQLIPHLVSRLVFTGAGGLDPFSRGIEFCLSPRATHMEDVISPSSTSHRGIYHVKEESLAGAGWSRLHVLCGDTVCSPQSVALKVGTTSLVVAMIEAGLNPGQDVRLADPLAAIRAINTDPTLRTRVVVEGGARVTALAIQSRFLERAEANLHQPTMPPWAGRLCGEWRDMLDRLARNGTAVNRSLDWTVKQALFRQHGETRGFSVPILRFWNWLVRLPNLPLPDLAKTQPPDTEVLPSLPDPWRPEVERLDPELKALQPRWGQYAQFLKLRDELCEIDVRYGQVLPVGIHQTLLDQGLLGPAQPEFSPEQILHATRVPPERGRARARGEFVRQHSGTESIKCDWNLITSTNGKGIQLSDPTQTELPPWRSVIVPESPSPLTLRQTLLSARRQYEQGEFEAAFETLMSTGHVPYHHQRIYEAQYYHLFASIQCRRGYFEESLQSFLRIRECYGLTFGLMVDFLHLHRFGKLQPDLGAMAEWIHQGEQILQRHPEASNLEQFAFQEHRACFLWRSGRWDEAQSILEPLCQDPNLHQTCPRFLARAQVDLAIVRAHLGNLEPARHLLAEAEFLYRRGNYNGDLTDLALTTQARLASDQAEADQRLLAAEAIQTRSQNRLGLARTLLLQARHKPAPPGNDPRRARLVALRDTVPCLVEDPWLDRILTNWPLWTQVETNPPHEDRYWGL